MDHDHVPCPNCRLPVARSVSPSSPMVRCTRCGLRFMPAAYEIAPAPLVDATLAAPPPRTALATNPTVPGPAPPPPPVLVVNHEGTVPLSASPSSAARRQKGSGALEVVKVVLGGAVGLGIGYLLISWLQHRGPAEPKADPQAATAQLPVRRANTDVPFPVIKPLPETAANRSPPVYVPPPFQSVAPPSPSVVVPPLAGTPASPQPSPAPTVVSPPSPPSPPPPRQPLEGLADVLRLPPVVDTASRVLSQLHVPDGMALDFRFNSVAANIPAEAAFFAEPHKETTRTWLVCYSPDLSASQQSKKVLAELKHAGEELQFAWRTPIEDADVRRELSNCLLRVECGSASQTALLRAAVESNRLMVDVNRDVSAVDLGDVELPKEDSVRLEIAGLVGFPGGAELKNDKRVLRISERTTIQFQQVKGAEIQLELRQGGGGQLQLVMRPEFRENSASKFSMTLERLAGLRAGLEKSIPEGEAKLAALGKDLKALDRQIRDLGPRPEGAAFVAWRSKANQLQSAVSSCKRQISSLQRKLPEMRARLEVVPAMQQFLSEIRRNSSLSVRLYAECGDAQLLLVNAHLDPSSSSQTPSP